MSKDNLPTADALGNPASTPSDSGSVTQHFVTFYSPGTFMSEQDQKPIASWDVEAAQQMARSITQRHGATPYGFRFSTRGRGPKDPDSKEVASSNMYYLGGRIETREEVEARNDPKEETLRWNMRVNRIDRILINDNSWRFTTALKDGDVVLDWKASGITPSSTDGEDGGTT